MPLVLPPAAVGRMQPLAESGIGTLNTGRYRPVLRVLTGNAITDG